MEEDSEKRVQELVGNLMDKGLITQEDYDKKKDELLNNF
ncbi:SHOCT domain-containing protein [Thermodesulfobacteriota bacterium]